MLFPWNRLAAIAQATEGYAENYGAARTPDVVVHPIASTDRWVLMPFQEGPTLSDQIAAFEQGCPSVGARVEQAREIGMRLTGALRALARDEPVESGKPERQHLDLSPSNIILTPTTGEIRLIDLGPNHLYSRQVGIAEHDDSVYIAPEVKNRGSSAVADVYSIGIILMQILAGYLPRDGRVPDEIYETSPTLGRFLEDLVEEDPHKRLLLLPAHGHFSYTTLERSLRFAFDIAMNEPETSISAQRRWLARLLPSSREVQTQYRQLQVSRGSEVGGNHGSYLLLFSLVATACWWFIFAKTALFNLEDLVALRFSEIPKGDLRATLAIAFSQGLLGAKFYQTIFARLTARRVAGELATATEVCIRFMAVVALPATLLTVFWKPSLWAWVGAAVSMVVALTHWLTLIFVTRIYQAGARSQLSTIPPVDRAFARGYEQWWWTMLLYAFLIAAIALGLQTGYLKDRDAYVFGLVVVTIGIHYVSKLVMAGHAVRGSLARAFTIAERLAILRAHGVSVEEWPPRLWRTRAKERDTPTLDG